ncbi:MAG: hypothetical protein FJ191_02250 [Gammaproteobacteria bacterium]|nr:hypothetical protein [Gammaproteobacteria bacterium]
MMKPVTVGFGSLFAAHALVAAANDERLREQSAPARGWDPWQVWRTRVKVRAGPGPNGQRRGRN